MTRYVLSQLRRRWSRALALGAGILVAAVSFTLLTASSRTSAIEVRGQVQASFRASYDLLVRPPGSQSDIERDRGLVRNNFETGVTGGISEAQLATIRSVPGVDVAAPVAYLGWVTLRTGAVLRVGPHMRPDSLYRVTVAYRSNGLSRYDLGAATYLYYASKVGGCRDMLLWPGPQQAPFTPSPDLLCYEPPGGERNPVARGNVETGWSLYFPFLVAAIDPVAENRLVGLDQSVASGQPLTADQGPSQEQDGRLVVPVLASSRSYVDESVTIGLGEVARPDGQTWPQVLRDFRPPPGPGGGPNEPYRRVQRLPSEPVNDWVFSPDPLYDKLVEELRTPPSSRVDPFATQISMYWSAGPVDYVPRDANSLSPVAVDNPDSVWLTGEQGGRLRYAPVALDNADIQFRHLSPAYTNPDAAPALQAVGRFDPERVLRSERVNRVPLETYQPPLVEPGDERTRRILKGMPLAPDGNIGGYVSQPPYLLTTLAAARVFTDPQNFHLADGSAVTNAAAPISVVRIKVGGLTGSPRSDLARLRSAAKLITDRTGLLVDVVSGSSPAAQTIQLPPGQYGRPALTLNEGWSKLGVAAVIIDAIDRKSIALFTLILLVTVLFLANAGIASVRSRQREIGALLCVGWAPRHIFSAVLGEGILTGLVAGVVGAGVALAFVLGLNLDLPASRLLLIPPAAVLLTALSTMPAAIAASRRAPVDAVVAAPTRRQNRVGASTRWGLAWSNLANRRGRTMLGIVSVTVAVAATSMLTALTLAFRGAAAGTVLGRYVTLEVRAADWIATACTLGLVACFIADLVALSIHERTNEFVTLKATGWSPHHLAQVALAEGALLAIAGGVPGALIGAAVGLVLGAAVLTMIATVFAAVGLGIAISIAAAAVPAMSAARLPIAALADEF